MSKYIIINIPDDWHDCSAESLVSSGQFDEFIESTGYDFVCFVPTSVRPTILFKEKESQQ